MRIRTLTTLFVSSVLVASVFAGDNLKTKIAVMNKEVAASFLKNDGLKTFEKITRGAVTSDFKHIGDGQTMGYDQMLTTMKQSMAMLKVTSCKATTSHISEKGNKATSISKHDMRATMTGPDKKNHKFHMWGTTRDTYSKEVNTWKLAIMDWSESKMTMDGKPFDPTKMGGH